MAERVGEEQEPEHVYARSPAPEGLSRYAGNYVIIRDREVIAYERDHDFLMASGIYNPETDALHFVPLPGIRLFIKQITKVDRSKPEPMEPMSEEAIKRYRERLES